MEKKKAALSSRQRRNGPKEHLGQYSPVLLESQRMSEKLELSKNIALIKLWRQDLGFKDLLLFYQNSGIYLLRGASSWQKPMAQGGGE